MLFLLLFFVFLVFLWVINYGYRQTPVKSSISSNSTPSSTISSATSSSYTTSSTITKSTPPVTSIPSSTPLNFGIADGSLAYLTQQNLMTQLEGIKSLGAQWVRFDMDWSVIQQNGPNSYNWRQYDQLVNDLQVVGLKGLGIIDYTPQWARPSDCSQNYQCAPADPTQFAQFAAQVVQRYAPEGMHTWEIWNEPNLTEYWQPTPNVTDYSNLLKLTYTQIKSVDPSALVISGGLSRASTDDDGDIAPIDFLTQLYQDGAGPYFDAVGLHPYTFPLPPSDFEPYNAWSQIASTSPSIRSVMIANGDSSKKIWITEFGAPTGGAGDLATMDNYIYTQDADHVDENLQSTILGNAVSLAQNSPWIAALFIYTYQDTNGSPYNSQNFFGLVRSDGSDKPAYTTIEDLLSK